MPSVMSIDSTASGDARVRSGGICNVGRTSPGLAEGFSVGKWADIVAREFGVVTCSGSFGPKDTSPGLHAEPGAVRRRAISPLCSLFADVPDTSTAVRSSRASVVLSAAACRTCGCRTGLKDVEAGGSELVAGGTVGLVCSNQERCSSKLLRVIGGSQYRNHWSGRIALIVARSAELMLRYGNPQIQRDEEVMSSLEGRQPR